jgi:hypothetical protein
MVPLQNPVYPLIKRFFGDGGEERGCLPGKTPHVDLK